jgi:phosphoribosylaminoimidazole-succinocarboxamide synthase
MTEININPDNLPSYDKQFVRDYLETLDWDKTPPAPTLPQEIIDRTREKYQQVRDILLKN